METLRKEIETALNRHSAENGSDTPDFILAEYLVGCLRAFDAAVSAREAWYGRSKEGVKDLGHNAPFSGERSESAATGS